MKTTIPTRFIAPPGHNGTPRYVWRGGVSKTLKL